MNNDEVFYNLNLSFIFCIREFFLKRCGLFEDVELKINSVQKEKSIFLSNTLCYTDGIGNPYSYIKVTSGSSNVLDSDYSVDYISGNIVFKRQLTQVVIKYRHYVAEVMDVYPDDIDSGFEKSKVCIDVNNYTSSPFEIGRNTKIWKVNYFIDFFSFNKMMRDRFSAGLSNFIRENSISLIDFSMNDILNKDGTLNMSFVFSDSAIFRFNDFGEISTSVDNEDSIDKKKMFNSSCFGVLKFIF